MVKGIAINSWNRNLQLEVNMNKIEKFWNNSIYIVYFIFSINIVISIIMSCIKVDSTEKYKSNVYMVTFMLFLSFICAAIFAFDYLNLLENTSIPSALFLAIQNIFSLVMTYFHWPYEVLEDQEYIDGTEQVPPSEFFTNSDNE